MVGLLFADEVESSEEYRFATEEEKQQLFDALAKEGKAWDAEKKQVVDLKPKVELKPFDKVLVRDFSRDKWSISFFSFKKEDCYVCINHCSWNQCIPYIGNESLLGTTKDVEGDLFDDYLNDMRIVQKYAEHNRRIIANRLVNALGVDIDPNSDKHSFTTIHNYIDTDKGILRKGAISAKKDEIVIIPMNMRDGSLICKGKGNKEWLCSAPHGAGRLMSRTQAKKELSMDSYKNEMNGIYSTSVCEETIDEAPMAYKPTEEIVELIKPTVDVIDVIKPIYNFKAKL